VLVRVCVCSDVKHGETGRLLIGSVAIGVGRDTYENCSDRRTACGLIDVDEELQRGLIQEHIAQGIAEQVRHKYSMLIERELARFA